MSAFPARFPGRCADCTERIEVDDLIRMTDDGAVHDSCDGEPAPERVQPKACPVCWLVHPEGGCDR